MNIKKEKSYMLVIPEIENDIIDIEGMFERLNGSTEFQLLSSSIKGGTITIKVKYHKREYKVDFYPTGFALPELYRIQHFFPDVDIEKLEKAQTGIAVEMFFNDNPLVSYHLQLKIIDAVLPDKLAVLDDSSEKILSGRWVTMEAESKVPPAPRYIYTVQAVYNNECVWLHTHGLNRCGITELEILNSSKETYNSHYTIIETMANRLLENPEPLKLKEPMYLARLSNDIYLVTTIVSWEEAIKLYDDEILGGKNDRKEGHNSDTSVVFAYRSKDDYEKENYEPVSIYDDILENNPIYMISSKETARMKALAIERINYIKEALQNQENKILVKIGLEVDEEYKDDENSYEHIWFELKQFDSDTIISELTQEPYYVSDIHVGYVGKYSIENITDWLIYTPERRLSPDDVYLLE